jgi:cold shock CspA family protein
VVEAFDEARGVGRVRSDTGARFPFHCTAIADGSRAVTEGTAVLFVLAPGQLGLLEAVGVLPVAGSLVGGSELGDGQV